MNVNARFKPANCHKINFTVFFHESCRTRNIAIVFFVKGITSFRVIRVAICLQQISTAIIIAVEYFSWC
jgi:hypothetical protein